MSTPQTLKENHLVVLDDDPVARQLIAAWLEPRGWVTHAIDDPHLAEATLRSTASGVLFTDIEMPCRSGLEVVKSIRENADLSDVFVIVISAHADTARVQQAMAAGADEYLSKPFELDRLVELTGEASMAVRLCNAERTENRSTA